MAVYENHSGTATFIANVQAHPIDIDKPRCARGVLAFKLRSGNIRADAE